MTGKPLSSLLGILRKHGVTEYLDTDEKTGRTVRVVLAATAPPVAAKAEPPTADFEAPGGEELDDIAEGAPDMRFFLERTTASMRKPRHPAAPPPKVRSS